MALARGPFATVSLLVLGRITLALIGACSLLSPGIASGMGAAGGSLSSESGNPINDQGSNYQYRSNITSITPNVRGLNLQVLEFADRLLLTNHTGQTVTIFGYQGEPYARVLANGTAEQNVRSPATYLNTSFYGNVKVPASASPAAPPQWVVVDRTGQFEWHDHRIHWMSPLLPPEVKNKSRLTLVFAWQVPIEVGTQMGVVNGQLFWTPENSKASAAVIVIGVLIAVAGVLFVLFVRRRRSRTRPGGESPIDPGGPGRSAGEAW